jgi:Nitrile hydratase, alpha chain
MADTPLSQAHARVISRAWQDPAFKQQLLTDPNAALAQEGITVPSGLKVQVHENSAGVQHIVLPAKPAAGAAQTGNGVTMCVVCQAGQG